MTTLPFAAALLFAAADPAAPAAGGTLTGRILLGGDAPAAAPIEVNKDVAVCGDRGLTDRSLVVGEDGGIRDVVVWLDVRASGREPEPTGEDDPPPVVLDNVGCRFEPHVVLLRTGQELTITNSDPIPHQATAFLNRNIPFNESVPAGGAPVAKELGKGELVPVPVTCPIHPWMKAHLLVQPHRYMAKTDAAGRFSIAGLPPGEWTFRLWQERTGFLDSKELASPPPPGWDGAKLTVTIPGSGALDLGDVTADPAAFE